MNRTYPIENNSNLQVCDDGVWLHVKHGGLSASINLDVIALDRKGIVKDAFTLWLDRLKDNAAHYLPGPSDATPPKANDRQEGGSHYKNQGIQPWDYSAKNLLDWFQGEIVKYVTRWRKKGKVEDLRKARHVLDKYIEEVEAGVIQ